MSTTLLLAAGFAFASGAIYAYVGRRVGARTVAPDARLAADLFGVWWFGLALVTIVGGFRALAAATGVRDLSVFTATAYLNLFGLCVALWGLLFYLVYLWTGRRTLLWPLSLFYVAYFLTLVYYVTASRPVGVAVGAWQVGLEFATPLSGAIVTALLALLVFPQIAAAFAYFVLYFRVRDRTARFRIAVVAWSIIVWFVTPLVARAGGFAGSAAWNIASRSIGLAAALAILIAYNPPQWLRTRYGIQSVREEVNANA